MRRVYTAPDERVEAVVLDAVEGAIGACFGFPVRRLARALPPAVAWDERRNQYESSGFLRDLAARIPLDAVRVLGVTERDLFLPGLSFVFGQAILGGRVALISIARLQQAFYGFPPDLPLLLERVRTEAVHELGHTFGLVHCRDPLCMMSLSTDVTRVDAKRPQPCRTCAILLHESDDMVAVEPPSTRSGADE
ncbi:MAG: peptidase M54 [Deltaproteobacteria bacterium]|nr:MAG: peptidase M54 [Deltaproteobacteria bacterium]